MRALPDVYWIGGGSGGGKSTVTGLLADRYDLDAYRTDDVMSDHHRRSDPETSPHLAAFAAMSMDERWLLRSPQEMLESFHWYRGEAFDLIVDDLRARPAGRGVVAEGFRLFPRLVAPLLPDPDRAVWLLPTPEFRAYALADRGGLWTIAGRTSDPEKALANLLERDAMFTARTRAEALDLGLHVIDVDGSMPAAEVTDRVAALFRL